MPERVYVIVVETEGARDPERMPLLSQPGTGGQAQQLGHFVKLDYIFPADPRRLAEDFPEFEVRLDPSPQAFFGGEPAP